MARKTGLPMSFSGYTNAPEEPYKAVIYYMMTGGADSFNILVPRSDCRDGRDVYQEYKNARGSVALKKSSLLDIDATGSNQVCDTFAVNSKYAYLQQLYNEGQALFIANAGVLNKPLTKHDDYKKDANVQLFAHNHMRAENEKCDINDKAPGTGVGGRILDMLRRQGYHTSGKFVSIDSSFRVSLNYSNSIFNTSCFLAFTANTVDTGGGFLKGSSYDNNPVWAVPLKDPVELDRYSSVGPTMLDLVKDLNGVGSEDDGFLGATWSVKTSKALFEYQKSLEYAELFDSPEFDMGHYPESSSGLHNDFRAMAQYMKVCVE